MGISDSPSLSQIQAEFGGSPPIALSEYYGVSFNDGTIAPTSGSIIKFSNFRNKSKNPPPEATGGEVTLSSEYEFRSYSYDLGQNFDDDLDTDAQLVYTLNTGSLPGGLSISGQNLTGTLSTPGTYNFTIRATDTGGQSSTQDYKMTVIDDLPPTAVGGRVVTEYDQGQRVIYYFAEFGNVIDDDTMDHYFLSDDNLTYKIIDGSIPSNMTFYSGGAEDGFANGRIDGYAYDIGTHDFTIRATDRVGQTVTQDFRMIIYPRGEAVFTTPGTTTWTAPDLVTSVFVVCVGGGGGGGGYYSSGGAGGGLAYRNNITVTPGTSYNVTVGGGGNGITYSNGGAPGTVASSNGGTSSFISTSATGGQHAANLGLNLQPTGGFPSGTYTGGGNGGISEGDYGTPGMLSGGGGAGGYSGNGGNGAGSLGQAATLVDATNGSGGGGGGGGSSQAGGGGGGGVGLYGQGSNGEGGLSRYIATTSGINGKGGSGGSDGGLPNNAVGGSYGGGGGAVSSYTGAGLAGAGGAVRIIWGRGRSFPNNAT